MRIEICFKSIKTLSLPVSLVPFKSDANLKQQFTTSTIELGRAIQFIDKEFGKDYADATLLLDYGFQYGKSKQETYSGRKIITFSGEYNSLTSNIELRDSYLAELSKNRDSLKFYSRGLLDPSEAEQLTKLNPFRATVDSLTLIPTPSGHGKIIGELFEINKGVASRKPIDTFTTDDRNQMWWHPEKSGDFLLNLRDEKGAQHASLELNVKNPGSGSAKSSLFVSRFKGFEQDVLNNIDFAESPLTSFKDLIANTTKLSSVGLTDKNSNKKARLVSSAFDSEQSEPRQQTWPGVSVANEVFFKFTDSNSMIHRQDPMEIFRQSTANALAPLDQSSSLVV